MKNFKKYKIVIICLVVVLIAASVMFSLLFKKKGGNVELDKGHYLLAFCTSGEEGRQIHLALSEDGLNFETLNNGNAIFNQSFGSGSISNPSIVRDAIGIYHIIGADIDEQKDISSNHSLISWTSEDLITWKDETAIELRKLAGFENNTTALSPQAIWDEDEKKFLVCFSAIEQHKEDAKLSLFYSYTTDFIHLTAPKKLYEHFSSEDEAVSIDSPAIVFDQNQNIFKLFFKDESGKLFFASSKQISGDYENETQTKGIDKCDSFLTFSAKNDGLIIMAFSGGKVEIYHSSDWVKFKKMSDKLYSLPTNIISGDMVEISKSEYDKLSLAYGFSNDSGNRLITPFSTTAAGESQ